MSSYSFEVVNTIHDIRLEDWDEIVGSAVTVCHAVLSCYENSDIYLNKLRYFLLRDDQQNLQAVSIALIIDDASDFGIERIILGRLAERMKVLRNWFRPYLICGLVGHGSPVIVRQGKYQAQWTSKILNEMENYAKEHHISIGFSSVLPEQSGLISELTRRRYCHAIGLPEAKVNITWDDEKTYLEYLRAINKKYCHTANSEIKRFRKSGIIITEWDEKNEQPLYELLAKHHCDKNRIQFGLLPGFLTNLKKQLQEDCNVLVARKQQELVGVVVLLKSEDIGWAWKIGIDHLADENNFTYFNLAYYNILANASNNGMKKIWYGNAALYAKMRRGCSVELTHFFFRPRIALLVSLLRIIFTIQRPWYRKKFSSYLNSGKSTLM